MECPKCMNTMVPIEYGTEIKVLRCTGCRGLFCKRQALEQMRDEWLIDTVLDTGSATDGAKYNEIKDIPCPGCNSTMDHVQDNEQAHITLDICPDCDGVFLDAGELTDMKTVTLMDHVRRLLTMLGK